jgi:hypothetical protein
VCAPKIKGFETPFKSDQLPAKTKQNQPQNNGAQSKSGIVPKINKKMKKKIGELEKNWVSGYVGEKRGNRGVWWPVVGQKGQWWCGGWLGSNGWQWCVVGLDFRECLEEENGRGVTGGVRRYRTNGEDGGK